MPPAQQNSAAHQTILKGTGSDNCVYRKVTAKRLRPPLVTKMTSEPWPRLLFRATAFSALGMLVETSRHCFGSTHRSMPPTPRKILFAALLGIGGVLPLLPGCSTPASQTVFNPHELFREIGYLDAIQLSSSQKKPIFLFFSANWARDREKLIARTLSSEATVQLLRDRTIGLQIELTDLPDIAKKHRVTSAPLLVLIAPDGSELRRWKNLPRPESFAKELAILLNPAPTKSEFAEPQKQLEANSNTPSRDF